jgi:hypothetical protein
MRISSVFTSQYLKATDLPPGRDAHVIIERVDEADMGSGEMKLVAYFLGKQKGLVLNRTNAETLADALGDESDNWAGAQVTLFTTRVSYNGQMRDAIRVRAQRRAAPAQPPQSQHAPAQQHRTPPPTGPSTEDTGDEIPF